MLLIWEVEVQILNHVSAFDEAGNGIELLFYTTITSTDKMWDSLQTGPI